MVVGDELGKFDAGEAARIDEAERAIPGIREVGGPTGGLANAVQRQDDPNARRRPSALGSVAGGGEKLGLGVAEQVLQDADELDGQDRELLSQPSEQWPYGGLQSWLAFDPMASVRHDEL